MKITKTLAENIRLGIIDAKMDLAAGDANHEHEPIQYFGFDWSTGMVYNKIAERAYWYTYEHARARDS